MARFTQCVFFLLIPLLCTPGSCFIGHADFIITFKELYRDQASFSKVMEDYSLLVKYPEPVHGIAPVRLAPGMSREVAYELLSTDSRIEHVEPDYRVHTTGLPDDPLFYLQWSFYNPGNNRADIKAPEVWRIETGSRKIIITILDTGIDYLHPDLAANMWNNPGEIPGNGADDDGNGFVDDVYGWDFANKDSDPKDGNFHGTHVAGIVGAVTNNRLGVAGIMHEASLMAVKGITDAGWGYSSDLIAGIYYAVDNGAMVINASWGGGGYLDAMSEALDYARAHNVLFVAAAGNQWNNNNDLNPFYPASYTNDNVISVGASSEKDSVAIYSNIGSASVDLFAPGSSVFSTALDGGYRYGTGTSMAAPHVAGVLGLLMAMRPSMSYGDYKQTILRSVQPLPQMRSVCAAGGRLDALQALRTMGGSYTGGTLSADYTKKVMALLQYLNMNKGEK